MALSPQALTAHQLLDEILAAPMPVSFAADPTAGSGVFKDSDGLISFVNLSSSFIAKDPRFTTGQNVAGMVATFFASMRLRVFAYLKANPTKVLPGEAVPVTQWDPTVTHFMQNLMIDAGGFSAFQMVTENYSETQTTVDFSMDMIKMIFDAMVLPESVVVEATKFIQGIGATLRFSWDDKSKNFKTCLLGLCHEAVPTDASGDSYFYFPKIKYYYLSVNSSQQEFTSPCVDVQKVTYDFTYDYYVTAIKSSVLDETTDDYKNFVAFLQKAQTNNYKNADNVLDNILDSTTSTAPASLKGANALGIDLATYPKITVAAAATATP